MSPPERPSALTDLLNRKDVDVFRDGIAETCRHARTIQFALVTVAAFVLIAAASARQLSAEADRKSQEIDQRRQDADARREDLLDALTMLRRKTERGTLTKETKLLRVAEVDGALSAVRSNSISRAMFGTSALTDVTPQFDDYQEGIRRLDAATSQFDKLSVETETELPIIGSPVKSAYIFGFGPLLLLFIFSYLQLYLYVLNRRLNHLDEIFDDTDLSIPAEQRVDILYPFVAVFARYQPGLTRVLASLLFLWSTPAVLMIVAWLAHISGIHDALARVVTVLALCTTLLVNIVLSKRHPPFGIGTWKQVAAPLGDASAPSVEVTEEMTPISQLPDRPE
jgi:hypothetical protein